MVREVDIMGEPAKYRGIKYLSDEYYKAMDQCELKFNKKYCKNDMEKTHVSCLDFFFSDGFDVKGLSYGERNYCLGKCDEGSNPDAEIDIAIISDGDSCWWAKDIEPKRVIIETESLNEARKFADIGAN